MRPVRRATRAALAGGLLAALLTSLLPALPVAARGPVKVTGREIHASVEHQRTLQLPIEASHVALKWRGAHDATVSVAFATVAPTRFGTSTSWARSATRIDTSANRKNVATSAPASSSTLPTFQTRAFNGIRRPIVPRSGSAPD